ncbi:hypothetical protein Pcinc_019713 [Petrolisthes cinctipes]|uniref:Uncharacterized protein n=1 Tax=Petrolisthes cinctipes TaxID=88211 RepID=A0AAE1FJM9_PETCI|nr:hypothetical protein Pcinc_019713 [Petrolisthes cinctipes]
MKTKISTHNHNNNNKTTTTNPTTKIPPPPPGPNLSVLWKTTTCCWWWWWSWVVVVLLFNGVPSASCLNTDHCVTALGMKSGAIPDQHISASSQFDAAVNAKYGRAGVEAGGGAWCPRQQVTRDGQEHLEVYLMGHLFVVTKVEVQGRFGNGQGREYTETYKLQYWRPGLEHWATYTDGTGSQLLKGNSNTYLAQTSQLHPPVIAARVRFIPYSEHPRTVCMRVELYGCRYTDGLVSYSMRDGDARYGDDNLRDLTYDGARRLVRGGGGGGGGGGRELLSGGLGQLVDGETGHTNFRVDALGRNKGYEWVGWERRQEETDEGGEGDPLEITFQFSSIRNFSALHIYTNNFFTKDTQVFSRARVLFSVGGEYYDTQTPVEVVPEVDRIFEKARNVTLALHNTPGRFVRLQLYFALRWLLISEVTFQSVPCRCNISEEEEKPNATLPSATQGHEFEPPLHPSDPSSFPSGLVVGVLVTVGVVVVGVVPVVLLLLYYRSRQGTTGKTQPPSISPKDRKVSMKMKDLHINLSLASVNNGYSRANGNVYGHVAVDDDNVQGGSSSVGSSLYYHEPYKGRPQLASSSQYSLCTSTEYNTDDTATAKCSSPPQDVTGKCPSPHGLVLDSTVDYAVPDLNMTPPPPFSDVYKPLPAITTAPMDGHHLQEQITSTQQQRKESSAQQQHKESLTQQHKESSTQQQQHKESSTQQQRKESSTQQQRKESSKQQQQHKESSSYPLCLPVSAVASLPPPPQQQYLTASEFDNITSIQGVTGTVVYGESEGSDANYERPVSEISRNRLHSLEILGEGAFGLVRLCRVDNEINGGGSRLVVMKQLQLGAKEVTKKEFHREIQTLCRIDDPSVAGLVGKVTRSEPLCLLMEYMTCGDLHQFLRRHNCQDMDGGGYMGSERPLISYGGLIHIAVQVASGMRHLENLNLTHRDLAARNCLVDRCLNVKISDMAMSRPMYSKDYCRLGEDNILLPIRWMSWESLLQGRFTSKSDVWSFGVTLWEILTMARHQPYNELSDDGVLENLSHCCPGVPNMTLLPQPHLCSREMYDLMTACWRPCDRQRPPFWQVLMFLQRKHLGYTLDYP